MVDFRIVPSLPRTCSQFGRLALALVLLRLDGVVGFRAHMAEVLYIVIQKDAEGLRGGFLLLRFVCLLAPLLFGTAGRRTGLCGCGNFRQFFRLILGFCATSFCVFGFRRQVLRLTTGLSAIFWGGRRWHRRLQKAVASFQTGRNP